MPRWVVLEPSPPRAIRALSNLQAGLPWCLIPAGQSRFSSRRIGLEGHPEEAASMLGSIPHQGAEDWRCPSGLVAKACHNFPKRQ